MVGERDHKIAVHRLAFLKHSQTAARSASNLLLMLSIRLRPTNIALRLLVALVEREVVLIELDDRPIHRIAHYDWQVHEVHVNSLEFSL